MRERICTVGDCHKKLSARGMCVTHYERWRRAGGMGGQCSFSDCATGLYAKGFCHVHWQRLHRYGDPAVDHCPERKMTAEQRFRAKTEVLTNGCWRWNGAVVRTGYASFHDGKADVYAHRWAYEQFVGPVPVGMELDHVCHSQDSDCAGGWDCAHRACVNPDHLEAVSPLENVMRGNGPTARNAAKTHCDSGHPFDEANTYLRPEGGRTCIACHRERNRRWSARRREVV